ncbi:MAG: alpha/beta family hydrolase [Myxococcota bacterium]
MERPVLPFAPGAGAPSSSPWMTAWAERLGALGAVVPFDYPYQQRGSKSPDRLPKLVAAHVEAIGRARAAHPGAPVVLAGKSMGSRVGCHVAAEGLAEVAALVCFGYPLVGRGGKRRDEVLLALRTPILFVAGTRDPLCPLEALEAVRAKMEAPSSLWVVPTGDHSLQVTKARAREQPQEAHDDEILAAVRTFLASV